MPFITEAQAINNLRCAVAHAVQLRRVVETNANTHLLGFLDIHNQIAGRGDLGPNRLASASRFRRHLASAMEETRAWLAACYIEWANLAVVGRPIAGGNPAQIAISELYDYMVRTSRRFPSRGWTFGAPAAVGSPVGTGVLHRLNVDKDGFAFEAQTPDVKQAEVVRDQNSGATRGAEVIQLRGRSAAIDVLEQLGVGGGVQIAPPRIEEVSRFVRNPHFSRSTSVSTTPADWTISGTVTRDTNHRYRDFPNDASPASLQMTPGSSISQQIVTTNNARLSSAVPWFRSLAADRSQGLFNGILRMSLGPQFVQVDFGSGLHPTWEILNGGLGTDAWLENFQEDNLTFRIQCIGGSGGTYVNVDDILFGPWRAFDGGWYFPRPASTPWALGDLYQWTDSEDTSVGHIVRETWRFLRRTLPNESAVSGAAGLSADASIIEDPELTHTLLAAQVGAEVPV